MITRGKLSIFEDFQMHVPFTEEELQVDIPRDTRLNAQFSSTINITPSTYDYISTTGGGSTGTVVTRIYDTNMATSNTYIIHSTPQLRTKIRNKFKQLREKLSTKDKFNPFKFFKHIKGRLVELNEIDPDALNTVAILVQRARSVGQIALASSLENEKNRIERELSILRCGFNIYLREEDIVNFAEKAPRELKLDWIKNFTRVIPNGAEEILSQLILNKVFDNYVILHYDPKNTGSELTPKEKEKAKDPILFGVLKESRRLYFIADWIDEYCDLTLDVLLDKLNIKEEDRIMDLNVIKTSKENL